MDADPNDDRYQNPKSAYLSNNFAPVRKEVEQENLTVLEGSIPVDLDGMYIRNGSNPQFDPIESYHWFQGDGMLHGVRIHNGTADYINRWVRTDVFEKEKAVGGPYFYSFLSTDTSSFSFLPSVLFQAVKEKMGLGVNRWNATDVANTSVIYHNNKFLALVESSFPRVVKLPEMDTLPKKYDFGGEWKHTFTAHPKIDPETGEMFFFAYSPVFAPYVCYGAISPSGKLLLDVSVPFEHGTMVHDFVITKNYAVIPIFPLKLGMKSGFDKTGKSKFAVIPRYAKDASSIIWLEFEPCFCFHYANAWEENEDELVVVGCPLPDGFELDKFSTQQRKVPVQPSHNFTKWTLNIKNKTVKSDVVFAGEAEFPTINTTLNGRKNTFAYVAFKSKPHADTAIGFDGVRKVNMSDSKYNDFVLPDGFTCGEWWFVPRPKKSNSEDDGYLFTFAHDFSSSTSQLVIVDAVTLKLATRIKTPQRVPAGFHGTWVSAEQIANQVLNDY